MLPSLEPGFIHSVDRNTRIVRVSIPGLTDGAEVMPEAQLLNPLGDKSEHTEIRLLPGDRVWLAFIGGDPRYPVIMGYRPKESDNVVGWRRWHHDNFQFDADGTFRVNAKAIELNAENITSTASTSFKVQAGTSEIATSGSQTMTSDTEIAANAPAVSIG